MPQIRENLPLINHLPVVPSERALALAWLTKRFRFDSAEVAVLVAELAFPRGPSR